MSSSVEERRGVLHSQLQGARGREVRFRPKRFSHELLQGVSCEVRFRDYDLRECQGKVVDFSRNGLAFRIASDEVLRNGERLRGLQLFVGGELVFTGDCSVVNQRPDDGLTIVGVSLVDEALDVERVLGVGEVAQISGSLDELQRSSDALIEADVPQMVKALAADVRLYLERWRTRLDAIEKELRVLDQPDLTNRLLDKLTPKFAHRFQRFAAHMNEMTLHLSEPRREPTRRYLMLHLQSLVHEAPFNKRGFEKPLGYAGDYMTMSYIHEARYRGASLFAKLLHRASCLLTGCRAVTGRNRYLKDQLRAVHERNPDRPARILSLACGPAQEIRDFLSENPDANVEITLIDQDREALEHCHGELSRLLLERRYSASLSFVNLAIKQLVRSAEFLERYGEQDLIFAAGLFDYLETLVSKRLTERLFSMLRPGGRLLIGNMGPAFDTQGFAEYLLDWHMIYRSEAQLLALADDLQPNRVRVEAEETGVNLFLVLES